MASGIFRKAKEQAWLGNVDIANDTLRGMLVDDTYIFNYESDYVSDISADELTSYTRVTISGAGVTEVVGANTVMIDCTDPVFPSVGTGQTAQGMIVYKQVGGDDTTPANDLLLFWVEFDTPVSTNGNNMNVTIDSNGIGRAT